MLKRLTFAVIVVGVFLTFGSFVFADTGIENLPRKARVFSDVEQTSRDVGKIMPDLSSPDGLQRPAPATPISDDLGPMPASPEHLCEIQDFCLYTGSYFSYDNHGDYGYYWANQYLVTEFGHIAEIYGMGVRIYDLGSDNGGCDLTAIIWEDDGGVPGAELYSETFAAGTFGTGFVEFVFSTPFQFSGLSYMMGFTITGHADDYISIGTYAENPEIDHGRSFWSNDPGSFWITTSTAFGNVRNLRGFSDVCYIYSECYTAGYLAPAYPVPLPSADDWGWENSETLAGFSQRFVSEGPDTVKVAKIQHLDMTVYGLPLGFYNETSTNYYTISIMGDNAGVPDPGNVYGSIDLGPGLDELAPYSGLAGLGTSWWDTLIVDFSSMNLVMLGPWHLVVEPSTNDPANGQLLFGINSLADGDGLGVNFIPPDPNWTYWENSANWTGAAGYPPEARSMKATVELCMDEFRVCENQVLYDSEPWGWDWLPISASTDVSNIGPTAQLVEAGGPYTRIETIRFQVEYGDGTPGIRVNIWSTGGTSFEGEPAPGAVLYSYDIPYEEVVFEPGWTELVIPGGAIVSGDFYVGYEVLATDPSVDLVWALTEDATGIQINGGALVYYWPLDEWLDVSAQWGYTDNFMMECEFCSIPLSEWTCEAGSASDWTTINGNFARTGHSSEAIGDAWCDLTLDGQWTHPSWGIVFCGPVIWNDFVIQCFGGTSGSGYYFFDIDDIGAGPIDEITSTGYPNSIATQVRCTPTVADVGGTPTLFVAGGTAWSVSAYDLTTVPGVTQIWSADATNGWLGHDISGGIRYGNFIVLDDVVYFGDDAGLIHAANAADGTPYGGWAESYQLIGLPLSSGATDGSNLFYSAFTAGVEGDVVAIDAGDGTLTWSFAATSGLQAAVLWPDDYVAGSESFPGAPAVDGGEVYVNSSIAGAIDVAQTNNYGLFYRINAANGGLLSAAPGNETQTSHPLVDANYVLVGTFYESSYNCPNSDFDGTLLAYNRNTGNLDWASKPTVSECFRDWLNWEGSLTCEPEGVDDIAIFFSDGNGRKANLSFFNATTGDEYFNRRIEHGAGATRGSATAVGADSEGDVHVLAADQFGTIYNFTKGDDRPRLEILAWVGNQAVPFNTSSDTLVTFPGIYTNTGCTDLIVTLEASDTDNGVPIGSPQYGSVRKDFQTRAESMADRLAGNYSKFPAIHVDGTVEIDPQTVPSLRDLAVRSTTNRAAMATPAFLIEHGGPGDVFDPPGGGIVTAPGDTSGVSVYVDGPLINRGPQSFYVQFVEHNDPDYYLNDNSLVPQIQLTLVGGCLWDTTFLNFGAGGANFQIVFNTLQQGHTLYMDENGNLNVDGYFNGNFAGFFCYAISQRRLAFTSTNWRGGGDENVWIGIQADPNYIDDECKPAIATGVSLGMATTDGYTYEPLTGNMVYKSYIDSVQNFDDGFGAWDYTLYETAPFDNDSTIGIAGNGRCFGVVDAPAGFELLNNLFVEIMDLWERNGNEVPDWKFGGFFDNDMVVDWPGDFDTTYFDYSVSAGWATTNELDVGQSGYIKLPWGPGYDPMINAFPMERQQSANNDANGNNWDSLYFYMSLPPNTLYGHDQSTADDQDAFYTYDWHDFEPNGHHSFAVASFYFTDAVTNSASSEEFIAPASKLVNKWVGFGRGDVDNDDAVTLGDIISLAEYVHFEGPGPIPFLHLGDVNADGETNNDDVLYLKAWYFNEPGAEAPAGEWAM